MSPAERALAARIQYRAGRMQRELANRLLSAYELIRDSLTQTELSRAIQDGTFEALLDELLRDGAPGDPFRALRLRVDQAVQEAGRLASFDLPSNVRAAVFDTLSDDVVRAARTLDTRVIRGLKEEVRETVRQHVLRGMQEGVNPRTIARGARQLLDLAPNQEAAVANYRRLVETGDAQALTRALRDKRFDSTLRKAFASGQPLPAEKVERMVEAYHRGMVAFNAETHARTLSLDAQRAGQRVSWQDAISRGVVNEADLVRTWVTVGDDRVRPSHRQMNGETVAFGQRFSNGQMEPGETEYNCRCIVRVTLKRMALAA